MNVKSPSTTPAACRLVYSLTAARDSLAWNVCVSGCPLGNLIYSMREIEDNNSSADIFTLPYRKKIFIGI